MKRHMTLIAAFLIASLAAAGCVVPHADRALANPDPAHNARNSLDWAGTYRGTLPCADCEGIETIVTLAYDGRYETRWRYVGKDDQVFSDSGRLTWNEAGNTVTLGDDPPAHYFVAENRLIRLSEDGARVTGDLAPLYVLSKLDEGITEKYWKLVELNGRPVPALEREPYIILRAEDARLHGFGGCNGFTGAYELDAANSRIRFRDIAATMMACASGMEIESAFHEVLKKADNYSLDGDRLTLNRARMAPLARFEAVYLY